MAPQEPEAPHVAPIDVCLAGVFIGRGEAIPDDLYEAWRRRLVAMGLEGEAPEATPEPVR